MKKILFALVLLAAVDARAARNPPPAPMPPIIVDTHDLYPDHAPCWWQRWFRILPIRFFAR